MTISRQIRVPFESETGGAKQDVMEKNSRQDQYQEIDVTLKKYGSFQRFRIKIFFSQTYQPYNVQCEWNQFVFHTPLHTTTRSMLTFYWRIKQFIKRSRQELKTSVFSDRDPIIDIDTDLDTFTTPSSLSKNYNINIRMGNGTHNFESS